MKTIYPVIKNPRSARAVPRDKGKVALRGRSLRPLGVVALRVETADISVYPLRSLCADITPPPGLSAR
jgi:hypothetical protein